MPCRVDDYGPPAIDICRQKLDSLTAMLCQVCSNLEKTNNLKLLPSNINTWWENHKKVDAERRRKEEADAKYQQDVKKWEETRPKRKE